MTGERVLLFYPSERLFFGLNGIGGLILMLTEDEQVAKVISFLTEHQTGTGRGIDTLKRIDIVMVVEHTQMAQSGLTKTIFQRHVVNETLILVRIGRAGSHLAANLKRYAVVPQSFGKLERVIGLGITRGRGTTLHTHRDINRLESISGDILNFTLQEGIERIVGLERRFVGRGEIHARGKHAQCQFSPLLLRHGLQLVVDGHVLGRVDGEHFTKAQYSILIEQQTVASEQLRLTDRGGTVLGEFSIISVEELDAVCQTKILV